MWMNVIKCKGKDTSSILFSSPENMDTLSECFPQSSFEEKEEFFFVCVDSGDTELLNILDSRRKTNNPSDIGRPSLESIRELLVENGRGEWIKDCSTTHIDRPETLETSLFSRENTNACWAEYLVA